MKKIVITGCSSGFGYNAAKHFAEKGHFVYATMRNIDSKNAEAASALWDFAKANGYQMEVLEMDVTSDESVNAAIAQTTDVDVLINNAGIGYGGPLEAYSSAQCLAQLDINIVGTLRVAKAVLPAMRSRKSGLIIQVSSIAGRLCNPGFGVYHASKWGLEGLSETMRYELAPLGIDVVIVEPGPFATHFFENIVQATNEEVAAAYQHVGAFLEGFGKQFEAMVADENMPTDPMVVVEAFDKLINTPAGSRPLRTIAGVDLGARHLNETVEPIRKAGLEAFGLADCDGPTILHKH